MADLRLGVLGCMMLFAFAQAQSGDVLHDCLFTPNCPIANIDDFKVLVKDIRRAVHWRSGVLKDIIPCLGTVEMTGAGKWGCYDDKMVEHTGCKKACDFVKKLLE